MPVGPSSRLKTFPVLLVIVVVFVVLNPSAPVSIQSHELSLKRISEYISLSMETSSATILSFGLNTIMILANTP